jgi:hypothetical protein
MLFWIVRPMEKLQNELGAPTAHHRYAQVGEWPAAGLSREAAARFVGVSPAMFDRLVREGVMPRPIPLRRRRIWFVETLTLRLRELSGLTGEMAVSTSMATNGTGSGPDTWMIRIRRLGDGRSS